MRVIKFFNTAVVFVFAVSFGFYPVPAYSVNVSAGGESYLDGFEVNEIIGVPVDDNELISYLDDIVAELNYVEETFTGEGAVNGFYDTIDDCMISASENHLPLIIAKEKISLAKRKLVKSVRELFPGIMLSYEHDRGFKIYKDDPDKTNNVNESQQFRREKIRASFTQPIFKGGALWNQVKADRANLQAAKYEYRKVELDLMIEVVRAYLTLVSSKTTYEYKRKLYMKLKNLEAVSREKQEAQIISEVEHLNVTSQLSQLEHDVASAREDYELNLIEFKKVLHLDIDEPVSVDTLNSSFLNWLEDYINSEEIKKEDESSKLKELEKIAYENRPEFMIRKYKLTASKYEEKVANSGWLPQVNLIAEFGQKAEAYMSVDNNPPWDEEHRIGIEFKWNFGGNTARYNYDKNRQGTGVEATDIDVGTDGYYDRVNNIGISVLDGLERFSVVKEAEIKKKESLLELDLAQKDIVSEVKEAYYAYNRALIKLKSVFKKIKYREKLVSLARHRSEINEIEISEYIQAELDLANENENLIKSVVDFFLSKVSLNRAIGKSDYLSLKDLDKL